MYLSSLLQLIIHLNIYVCKSQGNNILISKWHTRLVIRQTLEKPKVGVLYFLLQCSSFFFHISQPLDITQGKTSSQLPAKIVFSKVSEWHIVLTLPGMFAFWLENFETWNAVCGQMDILLVEFKPWILGNILANPGKSQIIMKTYLQRWPAFLSNVKSYSLQILRI